MNLNIVDLRGLDIYGSPSHDTSNRPALLPLMIASVNHGGYSTVVPRRVDKPRTSPDSCVHITALSLHMTMDLSIPKAKLGALWMETAFWGMYTVLFTMCVYILLFKMKNTGANKIVYLGTATIMYALSTAHVAIDFVRVIIAFADYENKGGALVYYARIWERVIVAREAVLALLGFFADALLIYRLWIVWEKRKRITLFPATLLIAWAACAFIAVWGFTQLKPGDDDHSGYVHRWAIISGSATLVLNVMVTTLIAGRIWWAGRQATRVFGVEHNRTYSKPLAIVIESGAISSVTILVTTVLYAEKLNIAHLLFDTFAQIAGMVPTLIIVRVGLGVSFQDSTDFYTATIQASSQLGSMAFSTPSHVSHAESLVPNLASIPMQIDEGVGVTDVPPEGDVAKPFGSRFNLV